jgi:hypothetical protein
MVPTAAFASVATSSFRDHLRSNGSNDTGTNVCADTTKGTGGLPAFFIPVMSEQLGSSHSCDDTFRNVTAVIGTFITWVVFLPGLFADIDHAVVALIVAIATTASISTADLRDGIVWADLSITSFVEFFDLLTPWCFYLFCFLFIEVFFLSRNLSWSLSPNNGTVFDVRLADYVIVIITDSFSNDDRLLLDDDGLGLLRLGEVLSRARIPM